MTCIICGSKGGFRCTIKGLTIGLCSCHLEDRRAYDSVASNKGCECSIQNPGGPGATSF